MPRTTTKPDRPAANAARRREERELMERIAQNQDSAAYEQLYRRYKEPLHHFLCSRGIDSMTAEDIVQDVMVTLWNKAGSYQSSKSSLSNWIHTIARNKSIDLFRHNGRVQQTEFDEQRTPDSLSERWSHGGADGEASERQRLDQLIHSLNRLSGKQRSVMYLSYFQGQSHSVIAQYLNIPIGTVKSRVRLALQSLRTDDTLSDWHFST